MSFSRTIHALTFHLFSNLVDQHLLANALFWIKALDPFPRDKVQAHRSVIHGPWASGHGHLMDLQTKQPLEDLP